jgi:hypothetical protein
LPTFAYPHPTFHDNVVCNEAKPDLKIRTPSQSETKTKACSEKDDAVSKDEDLPGDQDYLADGPLLDVQDMSMNLTQSDKFILQADRRWIRLQVKSSF